MSEIVDQVLDSVQNSEPSEVVIEEVTPVEESSLEESAPEETVEETVEESAPVEETVEESAPVEETVEETVEESAPVEETVEETVEESAPVEETVEESAPVEETVEETVEESAPVETVEETVEKSAPEEETVEETVEESAPEETVEESSPEETVEESAPEETVEESAPEEIVEESAPEEKSAPEEETIPIEQVVNEIQEILTEPVVENNSSDELPEDLKQRIAELDYLRECCGNWVGSGIRRSNFITAWRNKNVSIDSNVKYEDTLVHLEKFPEIIKLWAESKVNTDSNHFKNIESYTLNKSLFNEKNVTEKVEVLEYLVGLLTDGTKSKIKNKVLVDIINNLN